MYLSPIGIIINYHIIFYIQNSQDYNRKMYSFTNAQTSKGNHEVAPKTCFSKPC